MTNTCISSGKLSQIARDVTPKPAGRTSYMESWIAASCSGVVFRHKRNKEQPMAVLRISFHSHATPPGAGCALHKPTPAGARLYARSSCQDAFARAAPPSGAVQAALLASPTNPREIMRQNAEEAHPSGALNRRLAPSDLR